jgi:hypothetical protein
MKTLAFLFVASIILLFAGLLLSEGNSSPPPLQHLQTDTITVASGSANLESHKNLPPLPPTPPKETTKTFPPSPIVDALLKDDFCELISEMNTNYILHEGHAPQFVKAIGASSEMQKVFSQEGALYGSVTQNPDKLESIQEKFLFALRLSGFYVPHKTEENLPLARKILVKLEKEEPGNAAFPFFRFAIETKDPTLKEEAAKTLKEFSYKTYFDTYLLSMFQEIETLRWRSPSYHYSINAFINESVSLYGPAQAILDYDQKHKTDFAKIVGNLMLEDPLRARRAHQFFGFSYQQFDWGRELSKSDIPYSNAFSKSLEGWEENFHFPYPPYIDSKKCDPEIYENYMKSLVPLL